MDINKNILKISVFFCLMVTPLMAEESWSFAILGDTQWALKVCNPIEGTNDSLCLSADSLSDYRNPHSVAVDFVHQIQERLILNHDPKFLILLGDFGDEVDVQSVQTRATWAQELYDAQIGVFPVRGNHDEGPLVAREFLRLFPQTRTGEMNQTPIDALLWTDSAQIHPILSPGSPTFTIGKNFSSPACAEGRSYAFQEAGATFIFIDQFMDSRATYCPIADQISWIDSVLKARNSTTTPAFIFGHKPLIGVCHSDVLLGDNPGVDSINTTEFIKTLVNNGVRIYIAGHEHLFQHSMIEEPGDGGLQIQQAIFSGASWKFYPSFIPTMDEQYNLPAYGKTRETPFAQELGYIGYQIVQIEGERVEITSWGAPSGIKYGELIKSPDLRNQWSIRRVWGWSPRGKQTVLAPNASLTVLSDSFLGTQVRVMSGTWNASSKDFSRRVFSAFASTDWRSLPNLQSAAWTLWGLEKENGSLETPTFALAMSFNAEANTLSNLCLIRQDANSLWNCVGQGDFLMRPWRETDPLGTRGFDMERNEVWAVVNQGGTYAVGDPKTLKLSPQKKQNPSIKKGKERFFDLLGRIKKNKL